MLLSTTVKKLKYQAKALVLDSRDLGLPQRRRRCDIIAALPPKSSSNTSRISLKRSKAVNVKTLPTRRNIKAALRKLRKNGVDPTKQERCVDIAAGVKFQQVSTSCLPTLTRSGSPRCCLLFVLRFSGPSVSWCLRGL